MKLISRILLLVQFIITAHLSYSQSQLKYCNNNIAQIWSDLSSDSKNITKVEEFSNCFLLEYNNYPIIAQTIDAKLLTHLGINIFGDKIKESENSIVLDFIERYLLELLLESNNDNIANKTKFDQVNINGDINNIPLLSDKKDISLSIDSQNGRYNVKWDNSTSSFEISFPIDYSFITGNNKKELENNFSYDIQQYKCTNKTKDMMFLSSKIVKIADNVYMYNAGDYMVEQMKYTQYLEKSDDKYSYIIDKDYPIETLSNIISTSKIDSDITLNITQRKYGFVTEKYSCKLTDVIDFCLSQGCTPYFGIESEDDVNISVTLIMVNHDFCYNHMLYFKISRETLSQLSGNCDVEISTYIPTHNVENMYDDDSQVNSKHNIKL